MGAPASNEVSTVTSKGISRPQTCARARLMAVRASSTLLLVKGEPATSTRVPSTSITRVIRMMESLPVLSSADSARTSRTDCHLVVVSSGTVRS